MVKVGTYQARQLWEIVQDSTVQKEKVTEVIYSSGLGMIYPLSPPHHRFSDSSFSSPLAPSLLPNHWVAPTRTALAPFSRVTKSHIGSPVFRDSFFSLLLFPVSERSTEDH